MSTTISNNVVTTRKPHRCWGCTEIFPSGTSMRCCKTSDAGDMCISYWCKPCDEYVALMLKADPCLADDGLEFGCVHEDRIEVERAGGRT